ncbi:MAG TPA: PfkB family carbohydrate kinase [Terriglobales bacterium]|nr:PfkB family carbohydrate kinase [Terriglobales bacterium]
MRNVVWIPCLQSSGSASPCIDSSLPRQLLNLMTRHHKNERLLKLVESFSRVTVAVLGDLVADEFVFGEISRVSREAPVLILKYRDRIIVPGGGANAIYNLADLGVNVLPIGVVGDDDPGRALIKAFRQKRVPVSGIVKLKNYPTVTKTRILAGQTHSARQQVVRIDREPDRALDAKTLRSLQVAARQYARAADGFLISDYGYGAASPQMVQTLRTRNDLSGMTVTLDSRYRMLDFPGVTSATPNESEVEAALGITIGDDMDRLQAAGRALLQKMRLESLLITRGRDGMVSFAKGRQPVEIPIHGSDQVADVTGAGDTVIATLTAALAAGADAEDAARLANYAAGIVVMKRGTATASASELRAALEHA